MKDMRLHSDTGIVLRFEFSRDPETYALVTMYEPPESKKLGDPGDPGRWGSFNTRQLRKLRNAIDEALKSREAPDRPHDDWRST